MAGRATLSHSGAAALGVFDGVHKGHRKVLDAAVKCAKECGLIPCAFTFAAASMPVKQGNVLTYLYTDAQKRRLMAQCGIEAVYAPPFSAVQALDGEAFCRQVLVEQLHAVHVFCGKDFRFGVGAGWGVDDLCAFGASMGFQVHPVEPVLCGGSKISSTMIRRLLQAGKPEEAAQLLGAPYQLCSLVEHGAALGRTKAVPTINMSFAEGQLVPKYGVYVSRTHMAEFSWFSVTNIGVKPTVSDRGQAGAETFLLDFSGDLYGRECRVELLEFLRPEKCFPDVDSLYRQIAKDQAECRRRIWMLK